MNSAALLFSESICFFHMILPVYLTYFLLAQTELQWSLIFEGIRSMSWNELKTCDEVGISTFVGLLKAGVPLHILISYFFAAVVGLWFSWVAAMVQFAMFLCDRLARPLIPSFLAMIKTWWP